jgi:hypothetical protein
MTRSSPISARPSQSRLGRVLTLLAVASVGVALVYGGTTSALAQKGKAPAKADEKKTDDKKAVKKAAKLDGKILLNTKADYQTLANTIDQQIEAGLKTEDLTPSGTCTDEEFIRRVTLDLTGVIPTAEEVQKFLANKDSNRRAKLVDELLQNHRYGKFFGELWAKELLNKESVNKRLTETGLHKWFEERFNGNMHWDKMVYELITASGPQDQNGATTFFISNNAPEKMTDKITEHFLGVRLECAQCHNHPFTEYKQTEYWGMAAFFMNVSLSANPKNAAKNGNIIEVTEKAAGKGKKLKLPMEAKIVPPQFLKAEQPKLDKGEAYRPVLAKWLTAKTNPYFARAAVNKVWWHLVGRGLVNPHNDMHPDNPSSHPDLLATLADQYKQNDFDQKYLIRAICATKTYQRSSKPNATNGDDHEMFSHAFVRSMHPEQLFDSLTQVIGEVGKLEGGPKKGGNKGGPVGPRQKFVDFFTGDDGYKPLEYQAGIPQALMLMNAKQFNATTKAIAAATKTAKSPDAVIDYLYLCTVSRHATAAETQKLAAYVQKQANPQNAYGDILWALLNSSEFALNH